MRKTIIVTVLLLTFTLDAAAQAGGGLDTTDTLLQDVNQNGVIEVVAFGDSITRGRGDFIRPGTEIEGDLPAVVGEAGYPLRLERWLGLSIANLGQSGEELTNGGVPRFAREIPRLRPDLVLISEGINDTINRTSSGEFTRAMQTLINISFAVGAHPVVITIPPVCCNHGGEAPYEQAYNGAAELLARANDIPLVDVNKAFTNTCDRNECSLLNLPEGLHPNTDGYDVMGEAISAGLLKIDLFATDGPAQLEAALGLPAGTVKTEPDSAPAAP